MIKRMHHTGFVVRDLEKAVAFYRDALRLSVVGSYERTGPGIEKVVGYEGAHLKIAHLGAAGEQTIELIQYLSPTPDDRPTQERNVIGGAHLALVVDDIDEAFRSLVDNGATPLNPPTELGSGRIACYLHDPDGNWIELLQIAE